MRILFYANRPSINYGFFYRMKPFENRVKTIRIFIIKPGNFMKDIEYFIEHSFRFSPFRFYPKNRAMFVVEPLCYMIE